MYGLRNISRCTFYPAVACTADSYTLVYIHITYIPHQRHNKKLSTSTFGFRHFLHRFLVHVYVYIHMSQCSNSFSEAWMYTGCRGNKSKSAPENQGLLLLLPWQELPLFTLTWLAGHVMPGSIMSERDLIFALSISMSRRDCPYEPSGWLGGKALARTCNKQ